MDTDDRDDPVRVPLRENGPNREGDPRADRGAPLPKISRKR